MTEPSENEKATILAQILGSPEFLESKRNRDLLKYLVQHASTGESLKETEIARDVFGKDASFDPATDPLIRSYVSNLRKKLDHYYLTTDDQYGYRLEIPKGHYLVKYTAATPQKKTTQKSERFHRFCQPLVLGLSIAVVVLTYRELTHRTSPVAPQRIDPGPLWSEFTQPEGRPTLVVLGDYFFMRERGDSGAYYRRGKINSLDDFLEYSRRDPEFGRRYIANSFTYLRPSAPWGLMKVLPILQNVPSGVSLKLASQFTPSDFRTNNIVFIGSFRTLNVLKNFLHIFSLEYSTTPPSSFLVRDGIGDSVHVFRPERLSAGNLEKDYGVVTKGRGPDGSFIMMLLGFSEGGVIQAAHAASDPLLLKTLAEEYPPKTIHPDALTLVISAEGMSQSLFKADIKYVAGAGHPKPRSVSGPTDSTISK